MSRRSTTRSVRKSSCALPSLVHAPRSSKQPRFPRSSLYSSRRRLVGERAPRFAKKAALFLLPECESRLHLVLGVGKRGPGSMLQSIVAVTNAPESRTAGADLGRQIA